MKDWRFKSMILCAWFLAVTNGGPAPEKDLETYQDRMKFNIWEHLAKVANLSGFCLTQGLTPEEVLSTCLIPVCHQPQETQGGTDDPDDRYNHPLGWDYPYANWKHTTPKLPADAMELSTPHVASHNATCLRFVGCKADCQTPEGKPLSCGTEYNILSRKGHLKLPDGWFLTCHGQTYNYIPANMSSETQCCVSRLTLILPTKELLQKDQAQLTPRENYRARRAATLTTLDPTCDSNVRLMSHAEILSLAVSILGVPGLAAGTAKTVGKLACWAVKSINRTSTAISLLNREQQVLRQSILQNRMTLDYLLMRQHLGCEQFEGMCCFNLTDNSRSIDKQLESLHDLVNQVKEQQGGILASIWEALTSWLPDGSWLKPALVTTLGLVLLILLLCCLIPCLPRVIQLIWESCQPKKASIYALNVTSGESGNEFELEEMLWGKPKP